MSGTVEPRQHDTARLEGFSDALLGPLLALYWRWRMRRAQSPEPAPGV